jgi:pyridoxamine 5'-phosphate oxidase
MVPNPDPMPPWRPLLPAARQQEGRSPMARSLQLDLLTDRRSSKSAERQAEPHLELCWLRPKARSQFRLRGERLAREAGGLIKLGLK